MPSCSPIWGRGGTKFDANLPDNFWERIGESFGSGMVGGGMLHSVPIIVSGAMRAAAANSAANFATKQNELHAVVEQAVLKQTDPELFAQKLTELNPVLQEQVTVPMDEAVKLYQSGVDILTPLGVSLEAAQIDAAAGQSLTVSLASLHARLDQTQFEHASQIMQRGPESSRAVETATISEDMVRTFQQSLNTVETKQAEQAYVNYLTQEERTLFDSETTAIEGELTAAIRQNPNLFSQVQAASGVPEYVQTVMAPFRRFALLAARRTGKSPSELLRSTFLRNQARLRAREAEQRGDIEAQIGAELEDAELETREREPVQAEVSAQHQPADAVEATGDTEVTRADASVSPAVDTTEQVMPATGEQAQTMGDSAGQVEDVVAPVLDPVEQDAVQPAPKTEQKVSLETVPDETAPVQADAGAAADVNTDELPPRRVASVLPDTDPMNVLETARGEYAVRYEVWELGDVIPSHDPFAQFKRREDYPGIAQERAYHAVGREQEKVRNNAANLNPRFIITRATA